MRLEIPCDNAKIEAKIREKQCQCPHSCFKCPLCGLYKDNLFCKYREEIKVLYEIIEEYSQKLVINTPDFMPYSQEEINVRIEDKTQDDRSDFESKHRQNWED